MEKSRDKRKLLRCNWLHCFNVAEYFEAILETEQCPKLCDKHYAIAMGVLDGDGSRKDRAILNGILRRFPKKTGK